jgi:hypothetical protein
MVDADGGDRMILSELDGKLCAAHTSRRTETVTIWSRNDDGGWMTKHATMQLEQWPEFIAAVCEDSLFRPYDRIPRIW